MSAFINLNTIVKHAPTPNRVPRVRFSFGQHQEHGLWSVPTSNLRTSSSSAHAQKFEAPVGCQRFQKWTFTTTAQKLEVARARVLCADQKLTLGTRLPNPQLLLVALAASTVTYSCRLTGSQDDWAGLSDTS